MTESTTRPPTRLCPTCGSRVAEGAARCVVCGTVLRPGAGPGKARRASPQVTLSFPLAIGLLVAFTLLAAGLTFVAVRATGIGVASEPTLTPSITPTVTATSEPTETEAPTETPTPLPPIEYRVVEGDQCLGLAAFFGVSVQSIVQLNRLPSTCPLSIGQTLLIPQPTPTAQPPATETLSPAEATDAACEKLTYTVQDNDTLGGIAENYSVSIQAIMDYNGMTSQGVFSGQVLIIPLCERLPTPGPSPTATAPPPYPAPNLLLPRDGAPFTLADDTITLQWASVGPLRADEAYQVVVEDITEGSGTVRLVAQVTDTKFVIPVTFRPTDALPHIMRWFVETVRSAGTSAGGEIRFTIAGAASLKRDFTWSGAAPVATPTP
jgi:LysM repeat protein